MTRKKAVKVRKWITCAEPGCKRRAGTSKPYCGGHQKQFDKKAKAAVAKHKRVSEGRRKERHAAAKIESGKRQDQISPESHARAVNASRLIKAHCEKCGYTIRLSRKWIEVKRPICPVHLKNMVTAIDGEAGADPRQLKLKGSV